MLTILRRAVGAIVLLLIVLVGALYAVLYLSLPDYNRSAQVVGIAAPIEIARDDNGIPHIFAQSKADGYFGLGYVHGQDRLWQLEMTRRVANGRLAEAVGADGLSTDTLVAVMNVEAIAERTEARYSKDVRAAIAAYVGGINAAIANHKGPWPPEFLMLGIEPKPWTVRDVSRAGALVALGYGDWREELLRARMMPLVGCEALRALYASPADGGPVSYAEAQSAATVVQVSCGALTFAKGDDAYAAILPFGRTSPASNGWAVDGGKTQSGLPLLANDPHGSLTAPADYYVARISGPDFEIVGASRPGSPGFASGRNATLAWGVTDIMLDQTDVVVERLAGADHPDAYWDQGEVAPFQSRRVTIPVKGAKAKTIVVRSTKNGPVISDHDADAAHFVRQQLPKGHVAVLRGLDFPDGLPLVEALVGMPNASTVATFRDAAGYFQFQQNFVVADRDGSIAIVAAAHLPMRKGDGFLPVPAWDSRFDGGALLPKDAMPAVINPAKGFVMNANNRTMAGDGVWNSPSFEPAWRATRIHTSLESGTSLSMADMKALQTNIVSAEVAAVLPKLAKAKPKTREGKAALAKLLTWDGTMRADTAEPLIWNAWVRHLSLDILRPKLGDLADLYLTLNRPRLARLLDGEGGWCVGDPCALMLSQSLDTAAASLHAEYGPMADWQWGEAHKASFTHDIFSYLPVVGAHLVAAPATGGDAMTVNSGQTSLWSDRPFVQDYGPRYRQIIDLSAPQNSLFMIAPGVSGHPMSPWFDHFAPEWAANHYVTVSGALSDVSQRGVGRLTLSPRRSEH